MSDIPHNPYDTVSYPGYALSQAHPDRLATLATLFGMTPPDVSHCRVLELGCGDGTNVIAVALGLPEAECVGIDLAASGIEQGQGVGQELGVKNMTLRQFDMLDIGPDFGQFDFIIAHGLYSWVPPEVQDKLLSICKHNLSPNGVAYISYNAQPGGHLLDMVREMMRYHVSEFADPHQQVEQARALMQFLADSAGSELYRQVLQKELERIVQFRDSSLFHDDLSRYNTSVYFHEFIAHAARHGLKYLSEAHMFDMQAGIFPSDVVEVVNKISDNRIAKEQYLDFLKCRRFRQTLLCHADRALDDSPQPVKTASFYISSAVRPASANGNVDLWDQRKVAFLGPKNSSIETDKPLMKAALLSLGEAWPQVIHFNELLTIARAACAQGSAQQSLKESLKSDEDSLGLAGLLLRAYAGGLVEFHVDPPQLVSQPSERPVASPLARWQSQSGSSVTNLCQQTIVLKEPVERQLLMLLDGSRDRPVLLDTLTALAESGLITIQEDGNPVQDSRNVHQFLTDALEPALAHLARSALLVR